MRYLLAENTYVIGSFATGDTVTVSLLDLSDDSSVALDSSATTEIGTTGVFKWNTSNITTQPVVLTEYLAAITDGTTTQFLKLIVGGYPDSISDDITSLDIDIAALDTAITALDDVSIAQLSYVTGQIYTWTQQQGTTMTPAEKCTNSLCRSRTQ